MIRASEVWRNLSPCAAAPFLENTKRCLRLFQFTLALSLAACAAGPDAPNTPKASCERFPIQIRFETATEGRCRYFFHRRPESQYVNAYGEEFLRSETLVDGFIKLRYMKARPRSVVLYSPLQKQLRREYPQVKTHATAWGQPRELLVDGLRYEAQNFRLTTDENCAGFVRRWRPSSNGWKELLIGYLCVRNDDITDRRTSKLLSQVKI